MHMESSAKQFLDYVQVVAEKDAVTELLQSGRSVVQLYRTPGLSDSQARSLLGKVNNPPRICRYADFQITLYAIIEGSQYLLRFINEQKKKSNLVIY